MLLVKIGKQLLARLPALKWRKAGVELVLVELDNAARVVKDTVKVAPVAHRLGRQLRRREPCVKGLLVFTGGDGVCALHDGAAGPERRRRGIFAVIIGDVVEGIELFQRAKAALEVVDDGARHVGFGAISGNSRPPVDVVVDGGLFIFGVGEVGFLKGTERETLSKYVMEEVVNVVGGCKARTCVFQK